jgi:hypothetical protein
MFICRKSIVETTSTENRDRILNDIRKKEQITYKGKPIKITANFSTETLKARKSWSELFQALKENIFSPRILFQQNYNSKLMEE